MSRSPKDNAQIVENSAHGCQNSAHGYMQRVLELAAQGNATTDPNPRVGCVLVKGDEIVGEGFHYMAGELHAEREALKQAGEAARGATAYINLEPCCHQGRTPPCTDALIDAGVIKVVAAMLDPNPRVQGGGFELLKMAGIEVESGLLEADALWLNRGFVRRMRSERPWVVLKSAATLDGRTAAFDGESKWITGEQSRHQVQILRAESSAILTGIETVLADDPEMTVRLQGTVRQPLRVVLDSELRLPIDARIIGNDGQLVVFTLSKDLQKIAALTELSVEVIQQTNSDGQRLCIDDVLAELSKWQCNQVMVEAGQTLSGAFLESDAVDELRVFYAGTILGNQGKSMFQFNSPLPFSKKKNFQLVNAQMNGQDVVVSAVNEQSRLSLKPQNH